MSTADILKQRMEGRTPDTAIILGSSLGAISGSVEQATRIPYDELPGFPLPGISGHAGDAVVGVLGGREILALQGRVHPYEKGNAAAMRPVIEAVAALGITKLIITNAAGSLDPKVKAGRIMLITDHINFAGMNPLIGEKDDMGFVPMTRAYDPSLADKLRCAAKAAGIDLAEGVYMWFSGPSFETPAEVRMARLLGADAVGMSTVPEVILARHFGLRVAGLSVITNLGAGIEGAAPSHSETKRVGSRAANDMVRLIKRYMVEDEPE